ncbi:MAG: ABC transporter substrate-binding protein [Alphaproteobacteria bacterium]|jgi:peptide/nickel transport system substrate-binding protein|nr:ABC transporter substrate-binding protein [Alphaproteobacteria bacterium]
MSVWSRLKPLARLAPVAAGLLCAAAFPAWALDYKEPAMLQADVAAGKLPPVAQRLPSEPLVEDMDGKIRQVGKSGGDARMLIGRARDVRMISVYGYSRLVGYDEKFQLKPDILKSIDVEDDKVFTMHLRPGHKWSDGKPFTSEDFRYWWEDVTNNKELSPAGAIVDLMIEGELPKVEILDKETVRYSWTHRNPFFLQRLAGAAPLYIYRPSHYLKQFHAKYADKAALEAKAEEANARSWAELHNRLDTMGHFTNPDMPTLEPWNIATRPPAIRFVAVRNPYFHRVDPKGMQLPYFDRLIVSQADGKLIPAKSAAGEVDVQARNIAFNNFTFLKENEKRSGYRTFLWRTARGSQMALYPNLNANDPVWRELNRDVRYRRALSLAIDRQGINASLYFGLAIEGNNTVLPDSPLFKEVYQKAWTEFDLKLANKLLDEAGLNKRNPEGVRLLKDGRPLEIIVETSGEDTEQTDVLELIRDNWSKAGIKLFTKPSQREVLKNRIYAGETIMSIWYGLENGVPTAEMSPGELAPILQDSMQWPKWGQFYETKGQSGEAPDMPGPKELFELYGKWLDAANDQQRTEIWHRMLKIYTENEFSIGIVSGVPQPVVVGNAVRNVPEEGIYNFDPGAFFGVYRMSSFWFDR